MLVRRYYQLIEIAVKEFRIIALAGDNVRQLMQDLLFDLSNTVVDFAKEHLCVKETQKKLDKLEKELRAKVQDLLSC